MSPTFAPYSGLNLRSAKRFLAAQFRGAGLPFAEEDALDLVLGLTDMDRAAYAARGTEFISTDALDALRDAAGRRLAGEPVDRILGYRDFYGRRFAIEGVLSPRGDTEVLLLAALDAIRDVEHPHVLELGTGSGALAVSIVSESTGARVTATDTSADALRTARANARTHDAEGRLRLMEADWWAGVDGSFDAVISNPPYITDAAMRDLPAEVAGYDPDIALRGGSDGLDAYRVIVPGAAAHLSPEGWLGVEIGFDQAKAVSAMFRKAGFVDVRLQRDPAGLPRVVQGRRAASCPV